MQVSLAFLHVETPLSGQQLTVTAVAVAGKVDSGCVPNTTHSRANLLPQWPA